MLQVNIPEAIKNNAIWALIVAVGGLFAFYVNNVYMTRDAWADEWAAEKSALSSQIAKDIGWVFRQSLEMDGIQDSINDAEDRILELQLYVDAAPDSALTPAREQQIRVLETRKIQLERKLEEMRTQE